VWCVVCGVCGDGVWCGVCGVVCVVVVCGVCGGGVWCGKWGACDELPHEPVEKLKLSTQCG
jgi:hypothetical protein